jgi:hypothetical protein
MKSIQILQVVKPSRPRTQRGHHEPRDELVTIHCSPEVADALKHVVVIFESDPAGIRFSCYLSQKALCWSGASLAPLLLGGLITFFSLG